MKKTIIFILANLMACSINASINGTITNSTDVGEHNSILEQKEEKLYGALKGFLNIEQVKNIMDQYLEKYTSQIPRMNEFEKMILERSFQTAAQITGDSDFNMVLNKIHNYKNYTSENPEITDKLNNEISLYMLIDSINNNKVRLEKETINRIMRSCSSLSNEKLTSDKALWGISLYNSIWGINRPIGMMWLYSYRLQALNSGLKLMKDTKNVKGSVIEDATVLLALTGIYSLIEGMALPPAYTTSERYLSDLNIQQEAIIKEDFVLNKNNMEKIMLNVAKAQMKTLFSGSAGDALDADRSWYRGSFFTGIMAAWHSTKNKWFLEEAIKLGERTKWQPGPNAMKDANDLAITQTYLELYEEKPKDIYIESTRICMDKLIEKFNPKKIEWSWCDALFMSPPAWTRIGKITGDKRYFDQMNKLWWQTSEILYDKTEYLFYRDRTTVPHKNGISLKERNGEPIFWGRGNGWVVGGLCRVLEYLPNNYPDRSRYEEMLRSMCNRLLETQMNTGLWGASLLDKATYPMGETSGSTFFCYALAWGVNHGILKGDKYRHAALKAWKGLVACVDKETGKLGYVQLPADSPLSPVYRNTTNEYASGAFLLAASEIIKWL